MDGEMENAGKVNVERANGWICMPLCARIIPYLNRVKLVLCECVPLVRGSDTWDVVTGGPTGALTITVC